MNEDRLTEILAVQVMGWRVAPGRYIKRGRTWIPSWRFAPFTKIEDAFEVLEAAGSAYTLRGATGAIFEAEVHVGTSVGHASGGAKARTVCTALVRALGLHFAEGPVTAHATGPARSTSDAT
jgi:hypothetical protein